MARSELHSERRGARCVPEAAWTRRNARKSPCLDRVRDGQDLAYSSANFGRMASSPEAL